MLRIVSPVALLMKDNSPCLLKAGAVAPAVIVSVVLAAGGFLSPQAAAFTTRAMPSMVFCKMAIITIFLRLKIGKRW
jgi:uncharacterized membrane protein